MGRGGRWHFILFPHAQAGADPKPQGKGGLESTGEGRSIPTRCSAWAPVPLPPPASRPSVLRLIPAENLHLIQAEKLHLIQAEKLHFIPTKPWHPASAVTLSSPGRSPGPGWETLRSSCLFSPAQKQQRFQTENYFLNIQASPAPFLMRLLPLTTNLSTLPQQK